MSLTKLLKLLSVFTILTLYVVPTFASIQASFGLMSHRISDMSEHPGGVSLSVGKVFYVTPEFSMRPTFDFSFVKKTIKAQLNGFPIAESEFNDYSYGLSQRFSYKLPAALKMYVFADLGLGLSFASVELDTAFGEHEEDSRKLVYYKYNAGFQMLSDSGVGGELKYGYKGNKDYKGAFVDLSFVYTF